MNDRIEFFRHNIGDEEIQEVNAVLRSIFLTTGDKVSLFEKGLGEYLGIPYVIGLTSATGALHLSLLACDIGPGDEVITTPMSFIASANSIIMAGATPVFVDVEPQTGNINAGMIEEAVTEHTKAILPVHLYGNMCDMNSLQDIAGRKGLVIIEDCAHALESRRDGIRAGHSGETSCFSFYATKSITSGEGGAVATMNGDLAQKLKMLRSHGIETEAADRYTHKYRHYDMPILGWKYNMDNIQAALLLPQIAKIERFRVRREELVCRYEDAFSDVEGIGFPRPHAGEQSGRHLFTIWVRPEIRDEMVLALQEQNIGVAVNYRAIHLMKYYQDRYGFQRGMFPTAELIGDSTLSLPLYPLMTDEEVERVIDAVKKALQKLR